jgi:hypothetical protein
LGEGATGVVYRVRDEETGDEVALKALSRVTPEAVFHLKAEFRLLQDIRHRNLVRLYELFVDDAGCFFTMEMVDGLPLAQWVRPSATLDIERLLAVVRQLARGLGALHATGKLHRDVKPSNVMVDRTGRVVLLDFGLGITLRGEASELPPDIAGTLVYMAPEQAWGRPIGPPVDWYALGVVVYELVAGRVPFEHWEAVAGEHRGTPLGSLRAIVPTLPLALDGLVTRLLAPDPSSRPGLVDVLDALDRAAPERDHAQPTLRTVAPVGLVGRTGEAASLERAFEAVRTGHAALVRVRGPSGIGKTEIVRSVLARLAAREKVIPLTGRCHPEESLPFKAVDAVVDALTRVLLDLPEAVISAAGHRATGAMLRLFPVFGRVPALAAASELDDAADQPERRRRGFDAFRELLIHVARNNHVVIWIDDLQWGDVDGVLLLRHLLQPPHPVPLLLILSYRSSEPAPATAIVEDDGFASEVTQVTLELGPLDSVASAEVIHRSSSIPVAAEVTDAIVAEAGGSPFLLTELSRELSRRPGAAALPGFTLGEVIERRLAGLSDSARILLQAACVAGGPVERSLLLDAVFGSQHGRADLAELELERLVRSTLTGDTRHVEVYHDRVREEVLAHLPADRLKQTHAQLADALLRLPDADPEALLQHLLGAGDRERAAGQAIRAAERAERLLAFAHASALYTKAIELVDERDPRRPSLAEQRGEALRNAGRGRDAADAFLMAAGNRAGGSALDLRRRAAEQLLVSGHFEDGTLLLKRVLEEAHILFPATSRAATVSVVVRLARLAAQWRWSHLRDGVAIVARERRSLELCYSAAKGFIVFDPAMGAHFALLGLLRSLRAGDAQGAARGLAVIGGAFLGPIGGIMTRWGERMIERAREIAVQRKDPYLLGIVAVATAQLHLFLGRWSDALASANEGTALLAEQCRGVDWERTIGEMAALRALEELGRLVELRERAERVWRDGSERDDRYAEVTGRLYAAIGDLAADRPDSARRHAQAVRTLWSPNAAHVQVVYALRIEVACDVYEGDAPKAWGRLDTMWQMLRRSQLLRVSITRLDAHFLRARVALACASAPSQQDQMLKTANRDARALAREKRPDTRAAAAVIRAGLAACVGDFARASELLADGIRGFTHAGMVLQTWQARCRRAELLGADEVLEVRHAMRRCGVADVDRWLALQLPGFPVRSRNERDRDVRFGLDRPLAVDHEL